MEAKGVRSTQAERRSRSEEALLAAAAELIAERGVERASLAAIGARAGVSRGLANHHFGSKEALVARLAEGAQEQISAKMRARLAEQAEGSEEPSGLDIVYLTVDSYLELFEHPTAYERALLVMWGSTFPADSSVEGMVDAERRSYDGLSQVIAAGQRDGSIRPDLDPTAAAVLLLGMIRGVAALLLTDSALTDMGSVRQTLPRLGGWLGLRRGVRQPIWGAGRSTPKARSIRAESQCSLKLASWPSRKVTSATPSIRQRRSPASRPKTPANWGLASQTQCTAPARSSPWYDSHTNSPGASRGPASTAFQSSSRPRRCQSKGSSSRAKSSWTMASTTSREAFSKSR